MTYIPELTGTNPKIRARQLIEHAICESLVREFLSYGFFVTIDDGEDTPLVGSENLDDILKAMFSVDVEYLYLSKKGTPNYIGSVQLVYGNDGWDVISDYSTKLEEFMIKTNELSDKFADGEISPKKWWE